VGKIKKRALFQIKLCEALKSYYISQYNGKKSNTYALPEDKTRVFLTHLSSLDIKEKPVAVGSEYYLLPNIIFW